VTSEAARRTGIIVGSGAWHVLQQAGGFDLGEGEPHDTPFGPSRPIFEARLPGGRAVFLLTRHGEAGYDLGAWAVPYRANVWALKARGVDMVLATCACGAIDPSLAVGTFVVPHDLLDLTTRRAKTFFARSGLGVLRHAEPFCPACRSALARALAAAGLPHAAEGVCAVTDGPRLETSAEIRAYASLGATVVGMTLAPEFALARELEMCYAPLLWVVNPAEGVAERPYRPDVLFEGMATEAEQQAADAAAERVPGVLEAALGGLDGDRACDCRRAMQRYRDEGVIGDDWRTWVDTPEPRT
jgi:5'-methylthioadenosine phosphorylase